MGSRVAHGTALLAVVLKQRAQPVTFSHLEAEQDPGGILGTEAFKQDCGSGQGRGAETREKQTRNNSAPWGRSLFCLRDVHSDTPEFF